jgi:hypothetical protein
MVSNFLRVRQVLLFGTKRRESREQFYSDYLGGGGGVWPFRVVVLGW